MTPITRNRRFRFACHPEISCFNRCCRDLNQFLTPYDILRLKRRLHMTSSRFLSDYTIHHSGPQSGFPVVALRMDPGDDLKCPFVHSDGCQVYEDRPSSCRIYPLVRLASRSRETGHISERYFLIEEDHCLGFGGQQVQTVAHWTENQGVGTYNEENDRIIELISLKNRLLPDPFDSPTMQCIYTALYDLDRFKAWIIAGEVTVPVTNIHELDDIDLLKVGIEWVKQRFLDLSR